MRPRANSAPCRSRSATTSPLLKLPDAIDHADRQQAAPLALDRLTRPIVKHQKTSRLGRESDPSLARRDGLPLRNKQRADLLAGQNPRDISRLPAASDDHVFGRLASPFAQRSAWLAMPPLLQACLHIAHERPHRVVELGHSGNEFRPRLAWVAIVEPFDIREQNQQVALESSSSPLLPTGHCLQTLSSNSSTLTVSFSLMIGTAPRSKSVRIVLRTFR